MGKGWVAYLTAKMLYYKAFAEYYQAKFHKDEMEFGKCLCRYDTGFIFHFFCCFFKISQKNYKKKKQLSY